MTLDEFSQHYEGLGVDVDGVYGDQCMDLMHRYCMDVFGLDQSILSAPSAVQVYTNFPWIKGHEQFQKIDNKPWNAPQKGDILFFGSKVGSAGHVCIVLSANVWKFTSFDQNWPVGSPCHTQNHSYFGVLGWLRKNTK